MNGTDVFAVAPSNMGKGLPITKTVKQYARDANGVKLQSDGNWCFTNLVDGNVLELRNDGLYYGATPTVNQAYVSTR